MNGKNAHLNVQETEGSGIQEKNVYKKKGWLLALEREEKANQQVTARGQCAPGEMGDRRNHTGR